MGILHESILCVSVSTKKSSVLDLHQANRANAPNCCIVRRLASSCLNIQHTQAHMPLPTQSSSSSFCQKCRSEKKRNQCARVHFNSMTMAPIIVPIAIDVVDAEADRNSSVSTTQNRPPATAAHIKPSSHVEPLRHAHPFFPLVHCSSTTQLLFCVLQVYPSSHVRFSVHQQPGVPK